MINILLKFLTSSSETCHNPIKNNFVVSIQKKFCLQLKVSHLLVMISHTACLSFISQLSTRLHVALILLNTVAAATHSFSVDPYKVL